MSYFYRSYIYIYVCSFYKNVCNVFRIQKQNMCFLITTTNIALLLIKGRVKKFRNLFLELSYRRQQITWYISLSRIAREREKEMYIVNGKKNSEIIFINWKVCHLYYVHMEGVAKCACSSKGRPHSFSFSRQREGKLCGYYEAARGGK